MKALKLRGIFLYTAIAVIIVLFIAIVYFIIPKSDKHEVATSEVNATDSVKMENAVKDINHNDTISKMLAIPADFLIKENAVGTLFTLGEISHKAVNKVKSMYEVTTQKNGPDHFDFLYILKKDGVPQFVINNNPTGHISEIFVYSPEYRTSAGLHVGMTFGEIFSEFPNADMRYGDAYDSINEYSSAEMCKANGVLLLHFTPDDDTKMAIYDYDSMTFKLKNRNTRVKVDAILVTSAIW